MGALQAVARRAVQWALLDEGSTRVAALLRIGLVFLLWDRFAGDFLGYVLKPGLPTAIAFSFYPATLLLLLGAFTRFAAAWAAATMLALFYGLGIAGGVEPYQHHHVFLLVSLTVLLAFTPCGGSFSVDRWRAVVRAERAGQPVPPERGPLWGQRLIALQVSALYFWTAYDKCTAAFLSGQRLQHILISFYGSSDAPPFPYFARVMEGFAWATVGIEFLLAFGLWVPRLRLPLLILGILFHGMLYVSLPVGPFSCTIVLAYLAFFDPDRVHAVIDRLLGAPATARS